jgi:hypothetical protein
MPAATPPTSSKEKRILSAARGFAASENGKLILEYLEAAAGMRAPTFIGRQDGHACPYLAAQADGRKTLYLDLLKLIDRAKADENEEETKPKAKR